MHEMTDDEINKKHRRVRGSDSLRYPPNESRCRTTCGTRHDRILTTQGEKMVEHQCFLGVGHRIIRNMKVNRLSATQSQFVLERNDIFTHEIGAADWIGRVMLARHFLRVAWIILRRGRVRHSIEGGESEVLEDILDAEVVGD